MRKKHSDFFEKISYLSLIETYPKFPFTTGIKFLNFYLLELCMSIFLEEIYFEYSPAKYVYITLKGFKY